MKYTVDSLRPKLDCFLPSLLEHAGFELSYQLQAPENPHPEVENPEVTVQFSGSDVELLLANRAELLLALEHLSMEAMHLPPEDHSLISFDANDYRLLRIEELRMSALAAADKVKRTHVPFHFNPMTSRERRVIHLALREEKELRSESVGVGPTRAVVIVPADMPTPPAPPSSPRGPRPSGGARGGPARHGSGNRPPRHEGGNRPPRGGGHSGNR
ncbi:MAG: single-stranded DNA-binding protein [Acidobacteriaceae bacterium]|nr:single-stranded DNA-binding protein [Acidobacteriaceae bacterium]MBV9677042.1 single-stranded DNA-binding protein [Acidobacteriaceae bacterium]MBV9938937.1 single-stranded DNA-binding protein [Acidobacteriaceae bacterium]